MTPSSGVKWVTIALRPVGDVISLVYGNRLHIKGLSLEALVQDDFSLL
jgi:hypothetical protein